MTRVRVNKSGEDLTITIPGELLAQLNITDGDELLLTASEGHLTLHVASEDQQSIMEAFEKGLVQYDDALRELAK